MGSPPWVYTAGAISTVNQEYSGWRKTIGSVVSEVSFLHPTETYNEYEDHRRAGCVTEDVDMVERADAVIALISKPEQVGTITEVVHAAIQNIPILLLIAPSQWDYRGDRNLPYKIQTPLEYHSSEYWFLVNYLLGDIDVELPQGDVIPAWEGYQNTSAWITPRNDIPTLVEKWITETIL